MLPTDPFAGMTLYYHHAGPLWSFARKLATRFEQAEREQTPERELAALSVILFAAITVEAFLNELQNLASHEGKHDATVQALADAMEEVEDSHGSVQLKLLTVGLALGRPISKGSDLYQRFTLLFKVRNAIAHLKPYKHTYMEGAVSVSPSRLLDELHRQRGLIADPTARPSPPFFTMIATSALCNWAVKTAKDVVAHVVALLPSGRAKVKASEIAADIL